MNHLLADSIRSQMYVVESQLKRDMAFNLAITGPTSLISIANYMTRWIPVAGEEIRKIIQNVWDRIQSNHRLRDAISEAVKLPTARVLSDTKHG